MLVPPGSFFRRCAKETLYSVLHRTGAVAYFRRRYSRNFLVLTYHSFGSGNQGRSIQSIGISKFEKHIEYLKSHYQIIPLNETIARLGESDATCFKGLKKRPVSITVDDGYEDNHRYLLPLVKKLSFPATVFLSTDFLDTGRVPWPVRLREVIMGTTVRRLVEPLGLNLADHRSRVEACSRLKICLADMPPEQRLDCVEKISRDLKYENPSQYLPLSWNQVRQMNRSGIAFGSHTVYHSILTTQSQSVVQKELVESRGRIEAETGVLPASVSYPNGNTDDATVELVKKAGYGAAFTQEVGINVPAGNIYRLHRVNIPHNEGLGTFACRCAFVPNYRELYCL
jgi:peptidoglycan/xylan/chitin deacetylase (PgdA/CDA1 family)